MKCAFKNIPARRFCLIIAISAVVPAACRDPDEIDTRRAPQLAVEDDASLPSPAPTRLGLYFPGNSPTVLTSTSTVANTYYAEILGGHSWGECTRFRDGLSQLAATSYGAADRNYEFSMAVFPSRDCTGQRINKFAYQNQGKVTGFVRTSDPTIWFYSWQNLTSNGTGSYFMRLVGGKIEIMAAASIDDLKTKPFKPHRTAVLLK